MTETVSGRQYKSPRKRGFIEWSPRRDSQELIERVRGILTQYNAQLPLTIRQIFYILVGSEQGYEKTENAYNRLTELLNKARRAELIPFSAIRDDGTQSSGFSGWDSPADFGGYMRQLARGYRHNLTDGQPYHTELWVEAGGMVPQAAAVAGAYGIITYSAGGFNGLTDKYETAERLAGQDVPSIVLHCGDFDPSGLSILDSLAQDVEALAEGISDGEADIVFRRVVVTPDQIDRYRLPSAPQKATDRRGEWMDETVQAEALPPDILAQEIREAIELIVDEDILEEARQTGRDERDHVLGILNGITW